MLPGSHTDIISKIKINKSQKEAKAQTGKILLFLQTYFKV
jgi:hypothetical protein